jgi:DnaJ-class molecular chaperone
MAGKKERADLMRCQTCHGIGRVFDLSPLARQVRADMTPAEIGAQLEAAIKPCPDCGGGGQAHCCDGICAQPETADHSLNADRDLQSENKG